MIRLATPDDLEAIRLIASITWKEAYKDLIPLDIINRFIEDAYSPTVLERRIETTKFMVAVQDDYIVGFANYEIRDNDLYIVALYVLPTHQRAGVGSELLSFIEASVPDTIDQAYVDVENGNVSAETFYKKYGFVQKICIPDTLYGYPLKTLRMVYEVKR
ncbi:GNAT family N-acetyltransferase [Erysipelothrix rhusiopathiae]|uniref:GNAT family N-acetyltransferase n=1 Tax=Erysipelothrix rhusiopathiae TaxID=1648 RepID=UPI001EDCAC2A|nr:GNAT family N-acetyltransferase [Erysipelothrix rhusiopathiae]MCG4437175.1 GNAT family N-acetyltransferase [Erysipelothrix rhusiopathiae]MCG4457558.1 GNAT family N-acetyltransferase [Erysipelothrix rhusiopathiae]MDE8062436.1 GNAT family N-acetyltransferase [Erysipelothrix rhusiopathiae]MDE8065473.1 GNAT family N-acetyltransferase [Erysipelothrix rhusiopathiae]MDE8071890.1 GNAT family N-acetyltransferase [Erysipelothrix rhusiopathiae]